VAAPAAAGYALGKSSQHTRRCSRSERGSGNIAAALLIATENYPDAPVVVMLLVTTLAGVVVLLAAARWLASGAGQQVGE
jgi:predicted Na+-dependent transporter